VNTNCQTNSRVLSASRFFRRVEAPAAREGAGTSAERARPLILLVDDQPDGLESMKAVLDFEGFDVLTASSGAEALLMCRQQRPELAIVDVMMPGMTGFVLCEMLRTESPCSSMPIILYTARHVRPYSNTGLYDAAFTKPVEPDEIIRTIRGLLPK